MLCLPTQRYYIIWPINRQIITKFIYMYYVYLTSGCFLSACSVENNFSGHVHHLVRPVTLKQECWFSPTFHTLQN
jgi:hypothetical protein